MKINLKILILFFFVFVSACGFKPILIGNNYKFSIEINEDLGNKEVNSLIESRLKTINGKSKTFKINLDSIENKNIISKDSKGDPTILELVINLNYKLFENNKMLINKNLTEKSTYNNITDKFELSKFEEILRQNLIENFVSDITSSASNLIVNDN